MNRSAALQYVNSAVWAMPPDWVKMVARIAARGEPDAAAESLMLQTQAEPGRGMMLGGSTARIPIVGPIIRYGGMFTDISGATSQDRLRSDIAEAEADPSIEQIIFEIDSPGGEANGTLETAMMIRDLTTPTVAYISNQALSGAYWLASQADEIVGHENSTVGSVGAIVSLSAGSDDEEEPRVVLVSSRSPNKVVDLENDEHLASLQSWVDQLGDSFIKSVAEGRGMTEEEVVTNFKAGGFVMGSRALEAGGLDRIGTLADIFNGGANAMKIDSNQITLAWMKEHKPEVVSELTAELQLGLEVAQAASGDAVAEAVDQALGAERARVDGILGQSSPGFEDLVKKAVSDPEANAGSVAMDVLAQINKTRADARGNLADNVVAVVTEEAKAEAPDLSAAVTADDREDLHAEWKSTPALRDEFPSAESYAAFRIAASAGRARIHGHKSPA